MDNQKESTTQGTHAEEYFVSPKLLYLFIYIQYLCTVEAYG